MFQSLKIVDFLDELNSSAPTPGGGAVAALNGAEAAGLFAMVANVTNNKQLKKDLEPNKNLVKAVLMSSIHQNNLLQLMDADANAFKALMDCYKMPKETEEEKELRKVAIQNACKNACDPPIQTLKACLSLMNEARVTVAEGDRSVVSDAYIGSRLLVSAIHSSIYNLMININSIKDQEFCDKLKNMIDDAKAKIADFEKEVLDTCTL